MAKELLIHLFGQEGFDRIRRKEVTFCSVGVPIISLFSDTLTISTIGSGRIVVIGFWLSLLLFSIFTILIIARVRFCRRCAVPCVLAVISVVSFGGVALTQKVAGAQENGILAKIFPVVISIQNRILVMQEATQHSEQILVGMAADLKKLLQIVSSGGDTQKAIRDIRQTLSRVSGNVDDLTDSEVLRKAEYFIRDVSRRDVVVEKLDADVQQALTKSKILSSDFRLSEAKDVLNGSITEHSGGTKDRDEQRAALLVARGHIEQVQLNYRAASADIEEASGLVDTKSIPGCHYLNQSAELLARLGLSSNGELALKRADDMWRKLIALPDGVCDLRDVADAQAYRGTILAIAGVLSLRGVDAKSGEAVSLLEASLNASSYSRDPYEWARRQLMLGVALALDGLQKGNWTQLERSITLLEKALDRSSHDGVFEERAAAQEMLSTLLTLTGAVNRDLSRLRQAAVVAREAIDAASLSGDGLALSTASSMKALALTMAGAIQQDSTLLIEAIETARAAQGTSEENRNAEAWLRSIQSLGIGLYFLAETRNDQPKMLEGIEVLRAGLKRYVPIYTESPLKGSLIKMLMSSIASSLAGILEDMAAKTNDTARYKEAVSAYRESIELGDKKSMPYLWSVNNISLGQTLLEVGKRTEDTNTFNEAKSAFAAALSTLDCINSADECKEAESGMANAYMQIGCNASTWKSHIDMIREAIDHYENAFNYCVVRSKTTECRDLKRNQAFAMSVTGDLFGGMRTYREVVALYTGDNTGGLVEAKHNLGVVLMNLGYQSGNHAILEEAVSLLHQVLEATALEDDPLGWSTAQFQKGKALLRLGSGSLDLENLQDACRSLSAAEEQFSKMYSLEARDYIWRNYEASQELGKCNKYLAVMSGRLQ